MNDRDVAEKLAYANQASDCCSAMGGALAGSAYGLKDCEPKRAGLRERTRDAQYRAERESRKAVMMEELGHLLDKNPEVARILDLIEEVGR